VKSVEASPERVHQFPCPSCGADLLYDPQEGVLTCGYCGHKEAIPESAARVEERPYEQYLGMQSGQMGQLAASALEVQCQGCGAKSLFIPPEVAGRCEFCGVQIVAQPQLADPILAPEGLLPFRVTQPQAGASLHEWLSSRWFAPGGLKHFAQPEAIHGIYIPFWVYNTNTTTNYTGHRGEYYYTTETYTERDSQGRQVTRTRQVRHTRWFDASGTVLRWFGDLLIPATISLSSNRLRALEPWDLDSLKPYNPAFLAGFKAQRYQVGLEEGFERAKELMAPLIEGYVREDIGGDVQQIDHLVTDYYQTTFKHLLLPVYAGAYQFNGKVFQIVVNGRTGEIHGDRPYSVWKILLLIAFIAVVVLIVVYLSGEM
jgi:ribosomal protein S27E